MENVFRMVGDVVGHLTTLVIALIGLGIVGTLAFGDMGCLLYTSPSPRDRQKSRMPSSA